MSNIDITSRMDKNQARKLLAETLVKRPNSISLSSHCIFEMRADNLSTGDVMNVLHGGKIIDQPEERFGTWRYRVVTAAIVVVIAFGEGPSIRCVTAWRNRK